VTYVSTSEPHAGYLLQAQTVDQQLYSDMYGMKPLACMKMLKNVAELVLREGRTPLTLILPVDVIEQHAMTRFELLSALLEC